MPKSLADELMERRTAVINEARAIAQTGVAENRDLTTDEQGAFEALIHQADSLEKRAKAIHEGEQKAHELEESFRSVTGGEPWSANADACPSLLVSPENIVKHADAIQEGRSFGAVEERATIQVNPAAANALGGAQAWAQTQAREPIHLIRAAGIPVQTLTGVAATMPAFTLPTAAAGVNETTAHGEYDSVVDVPLTAARYGRWSAVSAAVSVFTSISGINNMHAIGIAKDLDKLAVGNVETAAGTPSAYSADIAGHTREALLSVAANVLADVEDLFIIGRPAAVALLGDVTPANGNDAGSVVSRFGGARLYATAAAAAGQLTVFHPQSFLVFQSKLQSASTIDPKDGSNTWGSWLHSTPVGQGLAGSALALDVTSP